TVALLACKAWLGQKEIEIGVPAAIHIVVPIETPRREQIAGLALMNGPMRKEPLPVFPLPSRIINITQVNNVLLDFSCLAFFDNTAHLVRHGDSAREARPPVTYKDQSRLVGDGHR